MALHLYAWREAEVCAIFACLICFPELADTMLSWMRPCMFPNSIVFDAVKQIFNLKLPYLNKDVTYSDPQVLQFL